MPTRILFATFVVLIALRDILSEVWLNESSLVFAFAISALISAMSLIALVVRGGLPAFLEKLRRPGVLTRAIPLGVLSALTYALGYFLVKRVGAGLFNVVDYGLTPIATLLLAKVFFGDKIKRGFWLSVGVYIVGVVLLNWYRDLTGIGYLLLILLIPVAVSLSDAFTKWLLSPDKGGFDKEELLLVRFFPGAVATALLAIFFGGGIVFENPLPLLVVSVLCGWLPLWLLCSALKKADLSQLAYWELLIPGLAFFGTLHLHPENVRLPLIFGAVLILSTQFILNRE